MENNIQVNKMSKTQDFVSEVTLEYLLNKEQYSKYLVQKNPQTRLNNKKDKKFYRRRIFDLTKQLLSNEKPETLSHDIKHSFDNYVNLCIEYFKALDTTDIIQGDYSNLNLDSKNEINIENIGSTEEANQLMMRSIKMSHPPSLLDNFVKVKNVKPQVQPIIPKQKDINLKDPVLKNKGILYLKKKKKNITNNYDKEENSENK
jgi:hypothetical protein